MIEEQRKKADVFWIKFPKKYPPSDVDEFTATDNVVHSNFLVYFVFVERGNIGDGYEFFFFFDTSMLGTEGLCQISKAIEDAVKGEKWTVHLSKNYPDHLTVAIAPDFGPYLNTALQDQLLHHIHEHYVPKAIIPLLDAMFAESEERMRKLDSALRIAPAMNL